MLFKFYRYWYFFAVTDSLRSSSRLSLTNITKSIYELKTTVLIKDKSENKLNPQDLLGMGLLNNQQNLQNEIGILTSYTMSYRAVTKIGLKVTYNVEDNFVTKELYKDCPYKVIMDTAFPQPINLWFKISLLSKTSSGFETNDELIKFYNFSKKSVVEDRIENVSCDETLSYGQEIRTKQFKFRVVLNDNFDEKKDVKKSFSFSFKNYDALVTEYKSFNIEPINKEASIVEIKLQRRKC